MKIGKVQEIEQDPDVFNFHEYFEGYSNPEFPEEAFDFVNNQLKRFGAPIPPEEVIIQSLILVYNVSLYLDVYIFMEEFLGIIFTEEWRKYTYEFLEDCDRHGSKKELNPENLITFRFDRSKTAEKFHFMISNPGLDAIPCGVGSSIREELEVLEDNISPYALNELRSMTREIGANIDTFVELICWASLLWIISPSDAAHDFRKTHYVFYDICEEDMECILYEGGLYDKNKYQRLERAPRSCIICGIESWCTELVYIDGTSRYMCEHHVNGDISTDVMCGTRYCRHTECPNHPMVNKGIKQVEFMRMTHGPKQSSIKRISGDRTKKISSC